MAFGLPELATFRVPDWDNVVKLFEATHFRAGDKVMTPEGEARFCQEDEGIAEAHFYHKGWDKPERVFYPVNKLRKGE
jgi:hypothetical protein